MYLNPYVEEFGTDDQSWLASRHGINNARSATFLLSGFTENNHYPNGFLQSGICVTETVDPGIYVPWSVGKPFAGVIQTSVRMPRDRGTWGNAKLVGPLLTHGRVVGDKLTNKPDAAGLATNPRIEVI